MAFTLFIKSDFLYSAFVPQVCLFTGRTADVRPVEHAVSVPSEGDGQISPLIWLSLISPTFLVAALLSGTRESLPIPAAPGAYARWQWLRNGWWLGLLAAGAAPCVVPVILGAPADDRQKFIWMGVVGGFFLAATAAAFFAGRSVTPSIKMFGRSDIRLRFPASMQTTYDAWLDAYFEYTEDQKLARKRVKTKWNSRLKYTSDSEETDGEEDSADAEEAAQEFETEHAESSPPEDGVEPHTETDDVPSEEKRQADGNQDDAPR